MFSVFGVKSKHAIKMYLPRNFKSACLMSTDPWRDRSNMVREDECFDATRERETRHEHVVRLWVVSVGA